MITNIALAGKMCSGKTTVARLYANTMEEVYGVRPHRIDMVGPFKEALAFKNGLTVDDIEMKKHLWREELQRVAENYRKRYGEKAFCQLALEDARKHRFNYTDNLRTLDQAAEFDNAGWLLVGIDCDESLRIERYRKLYGVEPSTDEQEHESEVGVEAIFRAGIPVFTNDTMESAELIALWLVGQVRESQDGDL